MLIGYLRRNKISEKIIYKLGKKRAQKIIEDIGFALTKKDSILDIGAGGCNISETLLTKGYNITPLDIENLSFVKNIDPVIYNGKRIPFSEKTFKKSMLLTVLHHTSNPQEVLCEAKRVSEKIIIMEDIYSNPLHKYLTFFFDSLINLEFKGHPHTNKTDAEWREIFKKLNLEIIKTKYTRSFIVFKHAIYSLKSTSNS